MSVSRLIFLLDVEKLLVELVIGLPLLTRLPGRILGLLLQVIVHGHDGWRLLASDVALARDRDEVGNGRGRLDICSRQLLSEDSKDNVCGVSIGRC